MSIHISRRTFLTGATAVAATSLLPVSACKSTKTDTNALVKPNGKPNSVFNGVNIGVITYSFRSMANTSDEVIKCCIGSGLSTIELMPHSFETEIGAPDFNNYRNKEKKLDDSEVRKLREKYQTDLDAFRKDPSTLDKWAAIGKKFKDAGIDIHIFKFVAGLSDELLDYSFKVAKILGAKAITTEIGEEACKKLGAAAERHGMLAAYHQHHQYSTTTVAEIEKLLSYSPANRLNWDFGHYFGAGWQNSTKLDPIQFLDKFHDKIFSIHLKDKTSHLTEAAPNQNQVWGQGQAPLRELLLHIRDNNYKHIYLDIEQEYAIAPWSDAVKEVGNCKRFAREVLI